MFSANHLQKIVPARSAKCQLGSEAFERGERYISCLKMEGEKVERLDCCLSCWKKKKNTIPFTIYWQGKVPLKNEKKCPTHDVEAFEQFVNIYKEGKEENKKRLYALALYLERRKQIIARGTNKNTLLFEVLATEEVYMIEKIPLPLHELTELLKLLL